MQDIILTLFGLIISTVAYYGLPVAGKLAESYVGKENADFLAKYAELFVRGAEQQFAKMPKPEDGSGLGALKMEAAHTALKAVLDSRNMSITESTIKLALEAAVQKVQLEKPLFLPAVIEAAGGIATAIAPAPAGETEAAKS